MGRTQGWTTELAGSQRRKKKKKKTPKNEVEVEVAEKDTAGNAVERQAAHFEGR
jgi:hypothetical protein